MQGQVTRVYIDSEKSDGSDKMRTQATQSGSKRKAIVATKRDNERQRAKTGDSKEKAKPQNSQQVPLSLVGFLKQKEAKSIILIH